MPGNLHEREDSLSFVEAQISDLGWELQDAIPANPREASDEN
jgi:hypothetical protein